MEIVFFPFSHLGKQQYNTLSVFFPHITFFPLTADLTHAPWLDELMHKGRLKPRFTPAAHLDGIQKTMDGYLEWVQLHKGNERNLKSLLKENPYFKDDAALTGIRSQLRRRIEAPPAAHDGMPPGVTSHADQKADPMLFLKFAQMADEQNETIDARLMQLEAAKAELFSELKGGEGLDMRGDPPGMASDPGATMTHERILNWLVYVNRAKAFPDGGRHRLLVTTSRAVFDHLDSIFGQRINALDIESIKVHEDGCERKPGWQECLIEACQSILETRSKWNKGLPEAQDGCKGTGRIKVALFEDEECKKEFGFEGRPVAVCLVELIGKPV